jgi:hypothetical protein
MREIAAELGVGEATLYRHLADHRAESDEARRTIEAASR